MNNQQTPQPHNAAPVTQTPYPIHRTIMLCPNCMKKKLLQDSPTTAYCDDCGQGYHKNEKELSVRFKF